MGGRRLGLTHFTASDGRSLLVAECGSTGSLVQKLNKTIGLFDGDLRQTAVFVE